MEIKSKYQIGDEVVYSQSTVKILNKTLNGTTLLWTYEVENRRNNFRAWVKECDLFAQ